MLRRILPSVLLAAALLAGCASSRDDADPRSPDAGASDPAPSSPSEGAPGDAFPEAPAAPAPASTAADAGLTVLDIEPLATPVTLTTTIVAGAFEQPRLYVPVGSTVTWRNVDDTVHTVSSLDGAFAGSGPLAPGMEFSRTFLSAGEYALHCRYHAGMEGAVIVG